MIVRGGHARTHVRPCTIADRDNLEPPQALPIEEAEKAKLLPVRSPLIRLKMVVHWIEQLNSHWFVGAWSSTREIDRDTFARWFTNGCIIS